MPSPACRHTMQNLGATRDRIFWCPRCGTVKSDTGGFENVNRPALVGLVATAEEMTVRTSVDGCSVQFAVPSWFWGAICEAAGVSVHPMPAILTTEGGGT
jgi:hypothetical protein